MGNFSNYWDLNTLFTKIKNKIKSVSDSIPTKLSDLTADATHRTVTDTEKSTWNGKSNFSGSYNDLTNKPTIPTKTSELTNNSNFVADSSYVHTDNNYTTAEKTKLSGIASGAEANVQSDWNQTNTTADDYIKNKPSLPLSAANGGTGKTTLEDAANALINSLSTGSSDPVDNDYFISQYASGGSSVTTYHRRPVSKLLNYIKSKLATVATSGSYNDLTNKPTIPAAANNGTLTIQKNGTTVKTFTANQSTNETANITVPTKTSELTNDSGYTTNTGTVTSVKVGSTSYNPSSGVVSLPAYPTSLPASDVYAWAKASTKPSYTASEVGLGNVGNFKAVSTVASQGLSSTEQANARANIGAGTSSFSGSYNDLSNKPTIPAAANNGTLTIQKNGTTVATFTANQSGNSTANITVPTTASDVNAAPASDVPFKFGVDSSGNYGYIKAGADTVTPFKTVGTRASNITANGTYTASSDISKDGYSSVTVAVPNSVQTKTVTPGTSQMYVTPDDGYIGLSQVTINVANNQYKTVSPTESAQIVRPDTGYWLSGVTVNAIETQTKSVTPSTSAQTVTPDSGKYLTSVGVGAISTQTKSVTPSTSAQTVTPDSGKYLTSVSVGAISTQTKSITATTNSQTVTPDSGKYLSSVTVYPQSHTETINVSANGTTSMGDTHNYKFVNSSGAYSAGYAARAPVVLWSQSYTTSTTSKTISIPNITKYAYILIICTPNTTTNKPCICGGFTPNALYAGSINNSHNVNLTYHAIMKTHLSGDVHRFVTVNTSSNSITISNLLTYSGSPYGSNMYWFNDLSSGGEKNLIPVQIIGLL